MAEDNLVNLEDDTPAAASSSPDRTPALQAGDSGSNPEAATTPEPQAAEVEAVEVAGQKYVPLAAVLAERKEKQALKQSAERAQQLEQEMATARPYVEFLKAHPELLQPRQQPEPVPASPSVDPEALQYARDFDLYTPEGKPDVEKAARLLKFHDDRAERRAKAVTQPVQQLLDQQLAAAMVQQASSIPVPKGMQAEQVNHAMHQMVERLPAHLRKDPGVMALVRAAAIGFTVEQNPLPATVPPPAGPPVVTEPAGRAPRSGLHLTSLDRVVAANKGIDEEKFAKLADGFTKGRTSQLED